MAPPRGRDPATGEVPLLQARGPTAGPSRVQRLAAWQGPDPTITLLVVLALAGCACLADQQVQLTKLRAPVTDQLPAEAGAALADGGESAVFGLAPGVVEWSLGTLAGLAALGAVVALLVCQSCCDRLLASALKEAFRGLEQRCPGVTVQLGRPRADIFRGRFEVRGCVVSNPEGYRSDRMMLVRRVSGEVAVWRLLRSMCRDLEVRALRLEGVDAVVEKRGAGQSNLQWVLLQLEDPSSKCALGPGPGVAIGQTTIEKIAVSTVQGARAEARGLRLDSLSKEMGVHSADGAVLALVRAIARAAAASAPA